MIVKAPPLYGSGWAVPRWAVAVTFLVVGLIAYSPYLGIGFSGDDFIFINLIEGAAPYNPGLGLWYGDAQSFRGLASLWWAEFEGSGGFLRPLASWMLNALYLIFGRNAAGFHVTLVILHAMNAFIVFLVLRRLSGQDAPAMLTAFLLLICEDHIMTVAWITTITDLSSAVFLNLALLCHLMSRQEHKPRLFGLSLLLWLAAITSKETAAVYPALVAVYEFLFADALSGRTEQVSFSERVRIFSRHGWAWGIPLVCFVGYMCLYRGLIPPLRSLAYVDPFSDPLRYMNMAAVNLPAMFVALLTPMLPSLVLMMPWLLPFVGVAGVVLAVLLLWVLLPYRRERSLWFSLIAFFLGLLPGLATEPGERLLYFSSAYGLFVVGWLLLHTPVCRRLLTPPTPPGVRILGSLWGGYLFLAAVIVPLVLFFLLPSMLIPGFQLPEQTVLDCLPLIDESQHEHVVYLNTNSAYNSFYLADIYRYHRGAYIDVRMLSSFYGRVSAMRESERTLVIRAESTGWLSNLFARVVRTEEELAVGDAYANELFTATVSAVTGDRRDVKEVRFEFALPLDEPSLVFLYHDGHEYRRWEGSPEFELLNPKLPTGQSFAL